MRTPCPEEPGPVCRLPAEERNPLPSRPLPILSGQASDEPRSATAATRHRWSHRRPGFRPPKGAETGTDKKRVPGRGRWLHLPGGGEGRAEAARTARGMRGGDRARTWG